MGDSCGKSMLFDTKMILQWSQNAAQIEQKSKKNIVTTRIDFGRVFFIDLFDFPARFGTIFSCFLLLFQKDGKVQNHGFYHGF